MHVSPTTNRRGRIMARTLTGLVPVMLTPFRPDGAVDEYALDALVEFYLEAGCGGLFANCLSSEMYELTPEERLALIHRVVERAGARVPVVATGTFGGAVAEQIAFIRCVADAGVDAVVLISGQLARADEPEALLEERLSQIVQATDGIPLGTYECPVPYKRLLSPGLLRRMAETGRFVYHKDTSCDLDAITSKVAAVRGSAFAFFNANTPTGLDSLRAGAWGLSPISANFYPELYAYLCGRYEKADSDGDVAYLQRMLTLMDAVTRLHYPLSAKRFLRRRGVPITDVCRTPVAPLTYEVDVMLGQLWETVAELADRLGLPLAPGQLRETGVPAVLT